MYYKKDSRGLRKAHCLYSVSFLVLGYCYDASASERKHFYSQKADSINFTVTTHFSLPTSHDSNAEASTGGDFPHSVCVVPPRTHV